MEINSKIVAASTAADIELSNAVQQVTQSQESAPVQKTESSESAPKLTAEQAKKEAEELEALLNKPADTEIKFNVKLVAAGGAEEAGRVTDFKFQVVEKGTGKIVRQFPPEDINGVKERAKAVPSVSGVLINSVA